ncbi:isopentenyl-diphosphate Delta-isomerase [Dyadobacter sp. 32]|uniref:isopentenyl-diphosphate Delta-isomerase n=1 Tax=Dyadobacter sp. 32 TaxID=538966 RepID=UPI0011EDE01A
MDDHVVLVNEQDDQIGLMQKLEVHQKGILHRAFSVFIFNSNHELLLQQRALGKYHSEGLWSNTCCSHPLPGETTAEAAVRRLDEEMGITAPLNFLYSFIYNAELDNGLTEHELDHVFWGMSDDLPVINTTEVGNYKYIAISELQKDLLENPDRYTEWLKICFEGVAAKILL